MEKKEMKTITTAVIMLAVGVLFCCSLSMAIRTISWILGTILIVIGVLDIIESLVKKQSIATPEGIIGGAFIAFGILFAGNELVWLVFNFTYWLLIVVGLILLIDSFIKKFKHHDNAKFISELILGVITLALGICLKFIDGFTEYTCLIAGLLLILYAIMMLIQVFMKKDAPASSKAKKTSKKSSK